MITKTRVSKGNLTVVPKHVRRSLGVGPGDVLEWTLQDGEAVVKPRKRRTVEDITAIMVVGGDAVRDKRKRRRSG